MTGKYNRTLPDSRSNMASNTHTSGEYMGIERIYY